MNRMLIVSAAALLILGTTLPGSIAAAADDLAPHVLAQVDETSGFRTRNHRAIRIFDDGKVESLEKEKWGEIGKLSAATAARLKRTTDVMSPKIKVATQDSGLADGPISTYLVRNKEGEIVQIGKKGPQDSILMQGGASSIMEILNGFKTLSSISY